MDESNSKKENAEGKRRFSQEQYDKLMQCSNEEKKKKEKDEKGGLWCNQWQYQLLKVCATDKEGIEHWNEWRKNNRMADVELEGKRFSKWHLQGVDLNGGRYEREGEKELIRQGEIYLKGTEWHRTNLRGAKLRDAHLESAFFYHADMQRAVFQGADVDNNTEFWKCNVDRKTNFRGVALDIVVIDPATKQFLEYNIRRMNWEGWYKEHWFWRWPVQLFWAMSDYGMSTVRVVGVFFLLAFLFAAVYMNWGYWWPPGIIHNLEVQPEIGEAGWHYCLRAVVRPVYFSVVTMTTLGFGDMYANKGSIAGHVILAVQVILGYVLLGALITRFAVLFTAGGPAGKFAESGKGPD